MGKLATIRFNVTCAKLRASYCSGLVSRYTIDWVYVIDTQNTYCKNKTCAGCESYTEKVTYIQVTDVWTRLDIHCTHKATHVLKGQHMYLKSNRRL